MKKYDFLVNWYIGVAKRRGWEEVERLLKEYPDDEIELKKRIKQEWKKLTLTKR